MNLKTLSNYLNKSSIKELYSENKRKYNIIINTPIFFLCFFHLYFLTILYLLLACFFYNYFIYNRTINNYIKTCIVITICSLFFYKPHYYSYYLLIIFAILFINIFQELLLTDNS